MDLVGFSPLGGMVMLHAIMQHMWYLRQCHRGDFTLLQSQSLERCLQRWETMSTMGLQQGSLTNKSLPRALELDGNALLKSTYFALYSDLRGGMLGLLSQDGPSMIAAIGTFAKGIPRSAFSDQAALCSTQVLLIFFNSGVVWINKIVSGASSLQFHIITSLQCCQCARSLF